MADQRAHFGLNQQVLGAATHLNDALPGQTDVQVFGNGPAQTAITHNHAADTLTFKVRRDATAGGFDFW
ncbi:hypothetical protein PSA5_11245 [Pseudomonas syringae pv. actinidiae]|nr:hypothetical protein PSA5_11245 [Pseudomonas syringae pv. actinidiae]